MTYNKIIELSAAPVSPNAQRGYKDSLNLARKSAHTDTADMAGPLPA